MAAQRCEGPVAPGDAGHQGPTYADLIVVFGIIPISVSQSDDWPQRARYAKEPRVGVCILRIEQQQDYVLITVTIDRNIEDSSSAQPEETTRYANRADALAAVERFLESFP